MRVDWDASAVRGASPPARSIVEIFIPSQLRFPLRSPLSLLPYQDMGNLRSKFPGTAARRSRGTERASHFPRPYLPMRLAPCHPHISYSSGLSASFAYCTCIQLFLVLFFSCRRNPAPPRCDAEWKKWSPPNAACVPHLMQCLRLRPYLIDHSLEAL